MPASNPKLAKSLNALLRHGTTELPSETLREARKCVIRDFISSSIRLRPLFHLVLYVGPGFNARMSIESFHLTNGVEGVVTKPWLVGLSISVFVLFSSPIPRSLYHSIMFRSVVIDFFRYPASNTGYFGTLY